VATDPYADSEAQFLAWIAGQGQQPAATDPYALGQVPTPTREEVPAGVLPAEPAPPPPSQDQWWPSSWLAGGDDVARAMNAPQTPAIGPEAAGAPAREPVATPAEGEQPPQPAGYSGIGPGEGPAPDGQRVPGFFGDLSGMFEEVGREYKYANDPLADPNDERVRARLNLMAQEEPEKYAEYAASKRVEAEQAAAAEKARRAKEIREQADRDLEILTKANAAAQAKTEQLMLESQQIAKTPIDRNRSFANASTGTKILGILQAVLGGLIAGRTGGPNQGLQMLLKEIDDDIEIQKAELGARRDDVNRRQTLVSQAFARTGDLYHAQTTARLAALRSLDDEIASFASQFDPRGQKFLAAQAERNKIRAEAAATAQKYHAEEKKRALEQAKYELDVLKQKETVRHAKAEEGIAWKNATTSAKRLELDEKKSDRDYLLEVRKENRQDRELRFRQDELAQKRKEALDKEDKEGGIGGVTKYEWVDGQVPDVVTGEMKPGKVAKVTTGLLKQADGTTFHTTAQEAEKLRKSRDGTQEMVDILDQARELRAKHGGANKVTSANLDARYKQLAAQAIVALNASKGVSISDRESVDLAKEAIFGGDPSSYIADDVVERIQLSLSQAVGNYHTQLKSRGYTGTLPSFDRAPPPATNTAEEDATRAILQDKAPSERSALLQAQDKRVSENRLSEEQENHLVEIMKAARSSDQQVRDGARRQLLNLATERVGISSPVIEFIYSEHPDIVAKAKSLATPARAAQIEAFELLWKQFGLGRGSYLWERLGYSNPLTNERYR
jgi:hypothetical protein